MIFVYPYIKTDFDFDIKHSMRYASLYFKDAVFYTIGDQIDGAKNIPCSKFNNIRGCDVTNKMLIFAKTIGGDFIYMNDDFYVNDRFKFNEPMCKGYLQVNPMHPPHYQTASKNTLEFLKYNNLKTLNFETHSPIIINSKKLIELFDSINWQEDNHFIKSLYLNYYPPESYTRGNNVKIREPNILKAEQFLHEYGCFSTGDEFLSNNGAEFIKMMS
jgi:hypothetical protein